MKKRRLIALAAAAVMAASSLAGCGGSQTTSQTTAGSTAETAAASSNAVSPDAKSTDQTLASGIAVGSSDGEAVKGGTLVVSMPSSPLTLDPKSYSTMYENHIMYNVMETLFIWDQDYKELLPCLATDYTASDDGLTYTINLRDDVYFQKGKFQDGRKMTAEDVKYSLERSKNESTTDRICRDFFDYCEVTSPTQVVIHMKSVAGPFINQLAEIGNVILPKEEVEGWGDEFGSHIVGTGPFTLEEMVTDEKVVLKARIKNADVIDEIMKDKNRISKRDKDKSIDDISYELGCNLDLNERKEYILYKMNKSCKKYEESQYDETVEVDVDQEDVYE